METLVKSAPIQVPVTGNSPVEELRRLFELQSAHKQHVRLSTVRDRRNKLKALRDAVLAHREEIQKAIYNDFRKPAAEVDYAEIYPSVSEIRHALENIEDWMAPREVDTPLLYLGTVSEVVMEPKGNCLILSPWNYPFQLPLCQLVSSIAAGNVAIIKPSEFTPHTAAILKKVISTVFSENEVAVVEGDHTVSAELLKLKWDHIHFTGSPAVGKIVMRAAAEHLSTITLELGGKSPVVVDETANIKAAVKKIAWGKFLNEGQTCIAPDYILVAENRKEEFVKLMRERITECFGAEPRQSPDLCRIVNRKHFYRIQGLLDDAVAKGAQIEAGGKVDENENYIAPTILTYVSEDALIMKEEIFGPLLPIITFKTLDEAIGFINRREKPLAMYIFSEKNKNQEKLVRETSAGGTCINDTMVHISQPNLPFGGVNNSGIGKSSGHYGFKEFSNERAVLKQLTRSSSAATLYPPYGNLVRRVVNLMLKYF